MSKEQIINVDQINDLPKMKLRISETIGDNNFEKKHIDLVCSGYNINECKESMDYLIDKLKEVLKE